MHDPNAADTHPAPIDPSPLDEDELQEVAESFVELLETRPEVLTFIGSKFFSGPLPPPDLLKQYDEVVPGFAATIVNQFVAQGDHRRQMEKAVILSDVARANWGLAAGFLLAFIGIIGSLYIINTGRTTAGITAFIVSLAPLVVAFLESTRRRRNERREKASQNLEE